MVDLLKRNGDKEIPLKETQYNYNRHIKERLKAEQHSRKITYYLLLSTAFLLLLTILFTWYRLKSHKQKLQLIEFQRDIAELKNKIVELHTRKEEKIQNPGADYSDTLLTGIERGEYNFIDSYLPPHIIRESDVYKIIREKIKRGQVIDMENQIWDDLEAVILSVFPTFTSDLVSLLDRPLKIQERVIVLMTKSGFSISDISAIIGRKKGVVTYHRKEMGKAIFKKEVKSVYIDPVIRLIGNIKINR